MADEEKKFSIPYGSGVTAPEDWDNEPAALAIERAREAAGIDYSRHNDGPVVDAAHDSVETTATSWPKLQETGYKVSIPKVVEDNRRDAEYIREAIHNPTVPQSWKAGPDQSPIVKAAVEALLRAHKGVEDYDKEAAQGVLPAKGTNGMSPRDTAVARAYPTARELASDYYSWAKGLVGSKKKP